MSEAGYARYLHRTQKREWKRVHLELPEPQAALAKLEQLLSKPWIWLMLPNNCVSFVEAVIAAGGARWYSVSKCPALAVTDRTDVMLFIARLVGGARHDHEATAGETSSI